MKKIITLVSFLLFFANMFSQTVVDLRDSTSSGSLYRAISNSAYTSGSTFILSNSRTYDLVKSSANTALTKSFTIKGDPSTSGKATINIVAQRSLYLSKAVTLDYLKFSNVKFIGGSSTIDSNGSYVFNGATYVATINKVTFDSCEFYRLRGVFRLRIAGASLDSISYNSCVFDSIGTLSVARAEDGSSINNILINNCTFVKVENLISVATTGTTDTLKISNCTFLDCPKNGSTALINYGTGTVLTKAISNCIFANVWELTNVDTAYIVSPSTLGVTFNNCYRTNDIVQMDSSYNVITRYPKSCTDLFTDTLVNRSYIKLNIKDASFAGATSAGDPQWYYSLSSSVKNTFDNNVTIWVKNNMLEFSAQVKEVLIYNINGQVVKSASEVNELSVSELNSGVYIVKVKDTEGKITVKKFIK
jgi:hypothetical protein